LDSAAVDNEAIRTLLDRNSGIFRIGLVGQIIPRKGHDLLLDALPGILDQVPQACVFFIGADLFEPDSRFEVSLQERLQASPGLRGRVQFTGYLENVEEVYGALDLLAIPSREETFGRVAIEAMAAGCPVVATRSGGLTEIIQSGRNGLLFDPENPSALAESIVELALNAGLRRDLIEKGHETAAQWDVVSGESAHRVEEVYRDLCRNQRQIGEEP
jgi:glycosyltransferase involved in cell wall biosynthesis